MKFYKVFTALCIFTLTLLLVSCEEEKPIEKASISVDKSSINFETNVAADQSVAVTSNRDWKAEISSTSGDVSWITVNPKSGSASESATAVTVSVLENNDEDRMATVTFNSGTEKAVVIVNQVGTKKKQYMALKDLRAIYAGDNVAIPDGTLIKGSVISNYRGEDMGGLNNATSQKTMIISDGQAGISMYLSANNTAFAVGDEVEIAVGGFELQRYQDKNALQINGVAVENITKVGTKVIEPKAVSVKDFMTGAYESMLITIPEVQVVEADLSKTFVMDEKHTSINMQSKAGDEFVMFSSKYSTYGEETVPQGSGSLTGIAAVFGTTYQISVVSTDGYKGLTGERFKFEQPINSKVVGDYSKWNALGASVGFSDNFSLVAESYQEYLKDSWMFYTNDGAKVNFGWKTGVYKDTKYIDIAPFASAADKVTAYALFQKSNVQDAADKTLKFSLAYYYKDAADDSKLEVVMSENFTGDFESATWTVIKDVSFASDATINVWTDFNIDLASSCGTKNNVAIAFRYTGKSNTYRLDNVQFAGKEFEDETPEPPAGGGVGDGVYTSNVELSDDADRGAKFYINEVIVDGETYPALKLGTSKEVGSYATPLSKTGDLTLTFYGVAWKAKAGELTISVEGGGSVEGTSTYSLVSNDGAANNTPFTITFGETDFYTVKLKGITADSKLKFSSSANKTRVILTGINVK